MSEALKQQVCANSTEFNKGVEAGLNSPEDTKNWQAGNELGQELKEAGWNEPGCEGRSNESSTSRSFDNIPGDKKNLQDEKDETEE